MKELRLGNCRECLFPHPARLARVFGCLKKAKGVVLCGNQQTVSQRAVLSIVRVEPSNIDTTAQSNVPWHRIFGAPHAGGAITLHL